MAGVPFLSGLSLTNYRSVASLNLRLGQLSFLVGPNGSGKSNILDALRFVMEALRMSLEHALRERGGIKEVRRRSGGGVGGQPTHLAIDVDFCLDSGSTGRYGFRIGARRNGGFVVQSEECVIRGPEALPLEQFFRVRSGVVSSSSKVFPPAVSDRLYLVNAAGLPEFKPVYDALSRMGFYNLSPDSIRELQPPDPGGVLVRDGRNLPSVLGQLGKSQPHAKERIEEYLGKIVLGICRVDRVAVGPKETLEFWQNLPTSARPWRFQAANMSDGTLRALGVLVALFQGQNGVESRVPLVGIEEPEVALHPGAAAVLLDAVFEAAETTQILITSHSPDLLDDPRISAETILAVSLENGQTRVGRLDPAGRSALRDRLYTAGELLRLSHVAPEPEPTQEPPTRQSVLFDGAGDR